MIDWTKPAALDCLSPEERRAALLAEFARIRELPHKRADASTMSVLTMRGIKATQTAAQKTRWRRKEVPTRTIAPRGDGPRRLALACIADVSKIEGHNCVICTESLVRGLRERMEEFTARRYCGKRCRAMAKHNLGLAARCRSLWDEGKSRHAIGKEVFGSGSSSSIARYLRRVGVTNEEMAQRSREMLAAKRDEHKRKLDAVKSLTAAKHSVKAICEATGLCETQVRGMIKS